MGHLDRLRRWVEGFPKRLRLSIPTLPFSVHRPMVRNSLNYVSWKVRAESLLI